MIQLFHFPIDQLFGIRLKSRVEIKVTEKIMIAVIYTERGSWLHGAIDKANTYIKIEEEYPEKWTQLFLLNIKWKNGCGETYLKRI